MSEKTTTSETLPLIREPLRRRSLLTTHCFTALGLLATVGLVSYFHQHPPNAPDVLKLTKHEDVPVPVPWSWNDVSVVEPSRELQWEKCYDDQFECARLDLPMDWLDPTDEERVVLGVIKLATKTKGANLSPVFVNPGGPGGSGIRFVQKAGHLLQTIVGDNHDIISFDPRGIGVSTPRVECWGSSQKRRLWSLQATPVVDERPGLVFDAYARAVAYSGTCEMAMQQTGIMRHLSTASVARDMLEILDKTGHEKLRYWGFSYGTVLGGVFAGLFPERVERLVSDGNCDYHDWFKLDHVNFLSDTDLIFHAFDKFCHKAGPDKCALWAPSPEAIRKRRDSLLAALKDSPVLIPAWALPTGPELPELITYSKLQSLTRGLIYKPSTKFPVMAQVYAALEAGDGMPYYNMVHGRGDDPANEEFCSLGDTPATMPQETGAEEDAFPAIMCSDGEPVEESPEEFAKYAVRMQEMSRWAGAANLYFRVLCLGRRVRPKWRFSDDDFIKGDTAHPILFIGNMADNVTPLESSYNNSARFPSSVVLTQNSYGHCSLAAASTCTARYVHEYFQSGALPPPGTECEQDYELFQFPDAVMGMDELATAAFRLANEAEVGW